MASYYSTAFFCVLLPFTILAYALVPKRVRWLVLLLVSYGFLGILSKWLIVFLWASTLIVYLAGLGFWAIYRTRDLELSRTSGGKKEIRHKYKAKARALLAAGILTNMGILAALKYSGFFVSVLQSLGWDVGVELPQIGAPVGISFYTLMAVSYLVDMYRETVEPDTHLGHVALYLCYFPYLMEGPIARYSSVAPSLWEGKPLRARDLYAGSLRILWGFAKKLIVADRLNPLVKQVFDSYGTYDGGIIAFAAILYTVQLYCDFSGTMDVALGMSRLFGVSLPENFAQPFFSKTASEFWQRWHITLGAWFKDYLYYPISLSRPCKSLTKRARRRFGGVVGPMLVSMVALFCVWLGNGLWHGAGTQYVAFGMYYFVIISLGGFVEPVAQRVAYRLGINRESAWYKTLRIVRTLAIVFAGELIFRATDARAALEMLDAVRTRFTVESLTNGSVLSLGLDAHDFLAAGIGVACVLALDLRKECGGTPWESITSKSASVRWAVLVLVLLAVVVFGAYGHGYTPVDPMYAKF